MKKETNRTIEEIETYQEAERRYKFYEKKALAYRRLAQEANETMEELLDVGLASEIKKARGEYKKSGGAPF